MTRAASRLALALLVTLALAFMLNAVAAGITCGGPVWCAKQVTF